MANAEITTRMLLRGKKCGGLLRDSYPRFYTNPGVERRVRASCRKREPFAPSTTGCSGQGRFVMANFRHLWSVLERRMVNQLGDSLSFIGGGERVAVCNRRSIATPGEPRAADKIRKRKCKCECACERE